MQLMSPLFLCGFLPLCILGFIAARKFNFKSQWLVVCSAVFYCLATDFSSPVWIIAPSCAILTYFLMGAGKKGRIAAIVLNIAVLAAVKITGISVTTGLSFVLLQCIACAASASEKGSFCTFMLCQMYFPKLSAGPLCCYGDFARSAEESSVSCHSFTQGMVRLTCGLAKKLLIAENLRGFANAGFNNPESSLACIITFFCCALQLYFDFSGCTDMAIGISEIFGITLPENFNAPFSACSLSEFWRRWHMTLSSFLKNYVYIPLGGSRKGKCRTALNIMIVFMVMGLWHGFRWQYVAFGIFHGLLCAMEHVNIIRVGKSLLGRIYTLAAVFASFVIFSAPSLSAGIGAIAGIFRLNFALSPAISLFSPGKVIALFAAVLLLFCKKKEHSLRPAALAASLILLALCLMESFAGGFTPFLYAGF